MEFGHGIKLSRNELKTVFYPGRKLELIACYLPMTAPSARTVFEHKSWGYVMTREDGRRSDLRFESGDQVFGISAGNGFTEVKIIDSEGVWSAHYRLL